MTKQESTILKGVAILLMLVHHFGNPSFLIDEMRTSLLPPPIWVEISGYCKITVAMFAFLSGYAMFELKEKYAGYKYTFDKAVKFLLSYWVVAFLFIIIGFASDDILPDLKTAVLNLIGFEVGLKEVLGYEYINVTFAWYVRFYLIVLLTMPLIIRLDKQLPHSIAVFAVIVICIISNFALKDCGYYLIKKLVLVYTEWMPCILFGYLANKYNIIDKLIRFHVPALFLFASTTVVIRHIIGSSLYGTSIDFIYTLFIVATVIGTIRRYQHKYLVKTLIFLGINSTSIWFLQSLFFIPSHKWTFLVIWSHNPLVEIAMGIGLSILLSTLLIPINNKIGKVKIASI